ncbi:hypothetical protein [Leifsonia sp. P73]|uniref:hypothetical protein n=1 Tax=Leifsonia sp. P73 TaxID=3423959 RepID=UPI003DA1F23E
MAVWLEIVKLTPPWLLPFVIVVAVLVVLFLLGRAVVRAWPAIKQFVLTVNAITGLPEFMERTDATLDAQNQKIGEIHHEVHFNNGSSVKDAAIRTERTALRVEKGVKGLYREIDALKKADADLRSELDDTRPKPQHPTQGDNPA